MSITNENYEVWLKYIEYIAQFDFAIEAELEARARSLLYKSNLTLDERYLKSVMDLTVDAIKAGSDAARALGVSICKAAPRFEDDNEA